MSNTEFKIDNAVNSLSGERFSAGGRVFPVNFTSTKKDPTNISFIDRTIVQFMEGHAALSMILRPGGTVDSHILFYYDNFRKCVLQGIEAAKDAVRSRMDATSGPLKREDIDALENLDKVSAWLEDLADTASPEISA